MRHLGAALAALAFAIAPGARAGVIEYGNENVLGTGSYSSDPKAGATLVGLAPGAVTNATLTEGHGFPFSPAVGAFPGTDQIYVGSHQTAAHDGYAGYSGRIAGPQVLTLDYSTAVPVGQVVQTLTLGIAADDFQQPTFGQPYVATINGSAVPSLTSALNDLDETGPNVHFFTIGVDPALLLPSKVLTVTIDQGGDGGDGWAVDFLTVGVTTVAVPEPTSALALALGASALGLARARCRRVAP